MQKTECPYCQHQNPVDAKFCQECGRKVKRSTDPLIGKQIGNHHLIRRIGVGGMGVVYLAEHINLGKKYAIKFLHPQFAADEEVVERFRREAQVIASLEHENIIRETDFGWMDGVGFYLIMDYLEGHTLKEVIRDHGAMSFARVWNIFDQLLDALQEAHEKGVVHRDLKPENLFLLQRRNKELLKILDFGIARIAYTRDHSRPEFTVDGEVYGSPTYMSPEQAQGDIQNVDHRSDLYSAGVILVEALTGRPPFQGSTPADVMLQHISSLAPSLVHLCPKAVFSARIEAIAQRALSKSRDERFQSAWEMREALRMAFEDAQEDTMPPALTSPMLAASPDLPDLAEDDDSPDGTVQNDLKEARHHLPPSALRPLTTEALGVSPIMPATPIASVDALTPFPRHSESAPPFEPSFGRAPSPTPIASQASGSWPPQSPPTTQSPSHGPLPPSGSFHGVPSPILSAESPTPSVPPTIAQEDWLLQRPPSLSPARSPADHPYTPTPSGRTPYPPSPSDSLAGRPALISPSSSSPSAEGNLSSVSLFQPINTIPRDATPWPSAPAPSPYPATIQDDDLEEPTASLRPKQPGASIFAFNSQTPSLGGTPFVSATPPLPIDLEQEESTRSTRTSGVTYASDLAESQEKANESASQPLLARFLANKVAVIAVGSVAGIGLLTLFVWLLSLRPRTLDSDTQIPDPPPVYGRGAFPSTPAKRSNLPRLQVSPIRRPFQTPSSISPTRFVRLRIITSPADAEVVVMGQGKVARTPCSLNFFYGTRITIQIRKSGYATREIKWLADRDGEVNHRLLRLDE